jgi:hypothetical protein
MPLQCNIDSKGRRARLIYGLGMLAGGIVLLLVKALPGGSAWTWFVTVSMLALGAFAVFEARAGWCAVRAMGFKTRY